MNRAFVVRAYAAHPVHAALLRLVLNLRPSAVAAEDVRAAGQCSLAKCSQATQCFGATGGSKSGMAQICMDVQYIPWQN